MPAKYEPQPYKAPPKHEPQPYKAPPKYQQQHETKQQQQHETTSKYQAQQYETKAPHMTSAAHDGQVKTITKTEHDTQYVSGLPILPFWVRLSVESWPSEYAVCKVEMLTTLERTMKETVTK
jgi:hypothetical protein